MQILNHCFLLTVLLLTSPAYAILPLFGLGDGFNLLDYLLSPSLLYYTQGFNYVFDDIMIWLGLKELDDSSCVNNGRWYNVLEDGENDQSYEKRLEGCFIYMPAMKKAYMIGGVFGGNDGPFPMTFQVDIYDPFAREWTQADGPGIQIDHFQCVDIDNKIWIVASWIGRDDPYDDLDFEQALADIVVYDPATGTWDMTREGLPESRRRGGAAIVAVGNDIYVMFGGQGGHIDEAVSVTWADKYDTLTDTWSELPDGTFARDHTGGGLVNGRICVAGGRITSVAFSATILPTECFDPETNSWSIEEDFPGRGTAGSLYGMTCDGQLMVAGGEYDAIADNMVYTFDGTKWTTQNRMRVPRHATHLAYIPDCNQMVTAAGSAKRGSGWKLGSTDVFFGNGKKEECVASSVS